MKKNKADSESNSIPKMRPALTPESRENQLIHLATNLAEKQLREGTASSQVISHYLKLGTTVARLEKEKLEKENELLRAKTEDVQSRKEIKKLYVDALRAMKNYSGQDDDDEDEYEYEYEY